MEENRQIYCDCDEMMEVLDIFGKRAYEDMKCCADKSCKKCTRFYADALIGWCLGENIFDEFIVENGKSQRTDHAL